MSKYRIVSILLLCLFVSHIVLEGLHHAVVQHVTCPEHGEQLHHDSSHDHAPHLSPSQTNVAQDTDIAAVAPDQEQAHQHHVCGICVETRKRLTIVFRAIVLWQLPPSAVLPAITQDAPLILPQQPRFTLAPKQSPPT